MRSRRTHIMRVKRWKLAERIAEREATWNSVAPAIVADEGEYISVDVLHPAYPRPGLGDVVDLITTRTGVKRFLQRLGGGCGCDRRRRAMNGIKVPTAAMIAMRRF